MRPRRVTGLGRNFLVVVSALFVLAPTAAAPAEEPTPAEDMPEKVRVSTRLSWETGEGKSFLLPAVEIGAFVFGLNQFNRHFLDSDDYDTDADTFWHNLKHSQVIDKDPFSINQLGHPYQGSLYYGFARSAGLSYWQALLYTIGGSALWETYGETTPPSLNDHVASGIGGSFLGEALFRMASLLLEGGGERPGFWRELGAALLSPSTGFNRLVFGDRFDPVFPSRDPAIFIRLRVGATLTTRVTNERLSDDITRQEGSADYAMTYGLPGKPGYRYRRPFDYFHFELTGVPNADSAANAIENVSLRGLLVGTSYDGGEAYRGVWGLFGGYDYLSPQLFRLSSTSVSLGTTGQWWLSRHIAVQGTALGGVGFGAAGTVGDRAERDYHYGVIPQVVLGLRLIFGDRVMLEATGRQYYVAGTGSAGGVSTDDFGGEIIARGTLGLSVRLYGPHAIGLQYVRSSRDARLAGLPDRHQAVETVSLSYSFLGRTRFGAIDWRVPDTAER
jgi:hypothetical protein